MLTTILMILAVVLLAVCAFGVERVRIVHLGWLGLAMWALAIVLGGIHLAT